MSYSRWSTSHWYTYWHAGSGFDRDDQYFDVCGVKVFTYGELKEDIKACLAVIKMEDPSATYEEMSELMGYMKEFMSDVESHKDINFYEDLKIGRITPELLEWCGTLKEADEIKESVDESFKILFADDNNLPLMMTELQTEIGKLLIEKRFRGILKQQVNGAVAQLGERDNGIVEAGDPAQLHLKNHENQI
jgi:hypothetical protein